MVRVLHTVPPMAASRSPQHEYALAWIAKGFPVFPWRRVNGQKRPCVKAWEDAATLDAAQVDEWWYKWPDAGIGSPPARSGHFVLDIDDKNGKSGSKTLERLGGVGSDAPYITFTPTGGVHYWFKGEARNSAGRIGEGIDIRGKGGWAALPDNAEYLGVEGGEGEAPKWLLDKLAELNQEREERTTETAVEPDLEINVATAEARVRDLVARGDVAIEGQGGNDRTYRLASELMDLGLSPERALECLAVHWNPHCLPPWSDSELEAIVKNASEYRQNDIGVKAHAEDGSIFRNVNTETPEGAVTQPVRKRFLPLSEDAQDSLTEPPWLVKGWIGHGLVTMLYGEPGAHKSFAALDVALSAAAGRPAWGTEAIDARPWPVVYIAPEGAIGIAKKRRPAWREFHSVDGPLPFWIIPEAPLVRDDTSLPALFGAIESECGDALPRLVVIDTYSRIMGGLDENSAQDASRAIEHAEAIKQRYNCAVLIIHHSAKGSDSERGSTALRGGVDTVIHCRTDMGSVQLSCVKQKDAEEPKPLWFRPQSVANSLVLVRSDRPQFVKAASQFTMDVVTCLREAGAVNLGASLTTNALAESLAKLNDDKGDPEVLRDKYRRQLTAWAKKEGKPFATPASPPDWFIPDADE